MLPNTVENDAEAKFLHASCKHEWLFYILRLQDMEVGTVSGPDGPTRGGYVTFLYILSHRTHFRTDQHAKCS